MQTIEDAIKSKPIKDPYHRAVLNIMYTAGWLQGQVNKALKPYGISEPQFNVLRILKGNKEKVMNLYEIQERMIQKMSNVSRLIDKLVEKGLVDRKECEGNRRRVDIMITQQGVTLLETLGPVIQKQLKELFANILKEEAELLNSLLDEIRG